MLKLRIISALILIPAILGALFYGPTWLLAGIMLFILASCAWEWSKLIPCTGWVSIVLFYGILAGASLLACTYYHYWLYLGLGLWCVLALAITTYPRSMSYWGNSIIVSFWGWLVLPLFVFAVINLYHQTEGKALILYLLLLIWAADTGAYFTGKKWGRHKLIPQVSPGKSWEGVLGGMLFSTLVASLAFFYFRPHLILQWFLLALGIVVVSIVGDLFISILKRRCGVKDSGNLIPGHGGILDRLDSLIAAAPWFYFGLYHLMG